MWGATACLQQCFTALYQLNKRKLEVDELAEICFWLPETVSTLPHFTHWEGQLQARVVRAFQGVHTLLTTYDQLQRFRQLPFQAVRAWAASDKLVIDSENSVAVAISWWCGGEQGSRASEEQLKELSGLLRVANLSNGKCATT
jgi:hypothetical protein